MVAFPMKDFMRGMKMAKAAFTEKASDTESLMKQIVELATVARRDGVLALESKLAGVTDAFFKKALQFLVDGVEASVARSALETEMDAEFEEEHGRREGLRVGGRFLSHGRILGAVLGLIPRHGEPVDPSKLVAVSRLRSLRRCYGVGTGELLFLPIANKLKRRLAIEKERKTMITEGVLAIQEGLNPRVLEEKLKAFLGGHAPPGSGESEVRGHGAQA